MNSYTSNKMGSNPCKLILAVLVITSLSSLTGCDFDYWWGRGQPPAPETLLNRSSKKLDTELQQTARTELKTSASELKADLLQASAAANSESANNAEFVAALEKVSAEFQALEGKLSFGSRPPYGELSGQLRALMSDVRQGGKVNGEAFDMFAARTFFFLASELTVPAPVTQ